MNGILDIIKSFVFKKKFKDFFFSLRFGKNIFRDIIKQIHITLVRVFPFKIKYNYSIAYCIVKEPQQFLRTLESSYK